MEQYGAGKNGLPPISDAANDAAIAIAADIVGRAKKHAVNIPNA